MRQTSKKDSGNQTKNLQTEGKGEKYAILPKNNSLMYEDDI